MKPKVYMTVSEFASFLYRERTRLQLTQWDMAKASGVAVESLRRAELGTPRKNFSSALNKIVSTVNKLAGSNVTIETAPTTTTTQTTRESKPVTLPRVNLPTSSNLPTTSNITIPITTDQFETMYRAFPKEAQISLFKRFATSL